MAYAHAKMSQFSHKNLILNVINMYVCFCTKIYVYV